MAEISLKGVSEEVMKIIVREQAQEKINRGTNQYSLSSTVCKIIKEWNNKCKKQE